MDVRVESSGFEQSVKAIAGERHNDELDRAVVGYALRRRDPVGGVEASVLLKNKARRRRRPENASGVRRGQLDRERRPTERLHGGQAPKAAGDGNVPASQRLLIRIGLADCAAQRVNSPDARARAPIYGQPVDGVVLGGRDRQRTQQRRQHRKG